jgi:hypothetical protein
MYESAQGRLMSPTIQNYDLYADETFLQGPTAFAFGAGERSQRRSPGILACFTPRRASGGIGD